MLVLTRRVGESLNIGDDVVVRILAYNQDHPDQVRIGIDAPPKVDIIRPEARFKQKRYKKIY